MVFVWSKLRVHANRVPSVEVPSSDCGSDSDNSDGPMGASSRLSGASTCTREHRVQQHVGPRLEVLGTGILDLVVADAVLAGYEDHRGGRDARNIDRIMAGAAHHLAMRIAECPRRGAHRIDAARVETRRREVVDLLQVAFEAKITRR